MKFIMSLTLPTSCAFATNIFLDAKYIFLYAAQPLSDEEPYTLTAHFFVKIKKEVNAHAIYTEALSNKITINYTRLHYFRIYFFLLQTRVHIALGGGAPDLVYYTTRGEPGRWAIKLSV